MHTYNFLSYLDNFSKKVDAYLVKKLNAMLNMDEELLKRKQSENNLFKRDELANYTQTETLINLTTFKPKVAKSLILSAAFIVFGVVFTLEATRGDKSALNFFPLVFTIYGMVMLLQFYSTKYELKNSCLMVYSLFESLEVNYSDIIEIEKRKINYSFKHGTKSRIRAETCADTIFITSSKPIKRQKYVIMISPKAQTEFINKIKANLQTNYERS